MITIKQWMEMVDYRITEGSTYNWRCYGDDAYCLDSWNNSPDGYSFSIIFDSKTQEVYEVQAHDYRYNRAYRMVNPNFKIEQKKEAAEREVNEIEAWEGVDYVDLEVDDDFIQKSLAIKDGKDYDTRVSIPIDFSDEELLKYMTMAHERDMTFNQFIEESLEHIIDEFKRNPEGLKARTQKWRENK